MTLAMVKQYHEFLLSHLVSPFSLLINKVNGYTYDFDAQVNLATLEEINAMAVVAYTRSTKISTESDMSLNCSTHTYTLSLLSPITLAGLPATMA